MSDETEISAERLSMIDAIVNGGTVLERWERHTGVTTFDDLVTWAERQLREVLMMRTHREKRAGQMPEDELEDYLVGKQAVLTPLLANMRQIVERMEQRELRDIAALQAIRRITGDTHRERPYTALSEIDQIARRALA